MTLFNEDYFERGIESGKSLYSNYRWIPELTIPMCSELIQQLHIKESDTVLDFGCAKGFLVKGMRLLHRKAYGVDVSEYAISNCIKDTFNYLKTIRITDDIPVLSATTRYDWCIAKDVLEHIDYNNIDLVLKKISTSCINTFAIVPLGKDGKYIVDAYELDKTHMIRESLEWWRDKFTKNNLDVVSSSYKMNHIKENYTEFEQGNGFFILKSNL